MGAYTECLTEYFYRVCPYVFEMGGIAVFAQSCSQDQPSVFGELVGLGMYIGGRLLADSNVNFSARNVAHQLDQRVSEELSDKIKDATPNDGSN